MFVVGAASFVNAAPHTVTTTPEQEDALARAAARENVPSVTVYIQQFIAGLANRALQKERAQAARSSAGVARRFQAASPADQARVNAILNQ